MKTIKDLLLAFLNATLILVAVCLFFGWKMAQQVSAVTNNLTEALDVVTPVRDELTATRTEVTALRSDIAALRQSGGELTSQAGQQLVSRIDTRMSKIDERMGAMRATMDKITQDPEALLDQAIARIGDELTTSVMEIRGCTPGS